MLSFHFKFENVKAISKFAKNFTDFIGYHHPINTKQTIYKEKNLGARNKTV